MPTQNDRYERVALVTPEYIKIPRGLHTSIHLEEPPYFPSGWKTYVNPEGSPFYVHDVKRIVTDDPIQREESCQTILGAYEELDLRIKAEGLRMPDDAECYIAADPEHDRCKYYFVDHTMQTVFWLEDIDPERHDIHLSPVCSVAQMKHLLQEQYWTHCEFFPHRPVPSALRKELNDTFRQARADQLTSDSSTFPYSAEQCKQYMQIINIDSRHRYNTFFGEDHARISRDQKRYDQPAIERPLAVRMCTALLFNLPKARTEELNMLLSDDLTYVIHWREFATELLRGWRESGYLSAGLLMISTVSTMGPNNPVSACLGSLSVVLSLAGMISSGILLQWYTGADKYNAGAANTHLDRVRSPTYGFEPIAQAYSAPRALVLWATIFLALHMLSAVVDLVGLIVQAPAIVLAFILFVLFLQMHSALNNAFSVSCSPKH
ncbi:hypothetical protein C8Q76DRAFT_791712 [Earliella scabrosa]|nr:hypothetical protein C8Q76DRAFT_791712 [Earliella scabrosa]